MLSATSSDLDSTRLALKLTDPRCTSENLVGGKGASLGLMTQQFLPFQNDALPVKIPAGICVTTTGFRRQVEANPDLAEAIAEVKSVCADHSLGIVPKAAMEQACQR